MSRVLRLIPAFLLLLLLTASASAADRTVSIVDFAFEPATVTVNVGDTVTWRNNGQAPHNAHATNNEFQTEVVGNDQVSGSHTFDEAGSYNYICDVHPNMKGTVVVQAAADGGDQQDDNAGNNGNDEDENNDDTATGGNEDNAGDEDNAGNEGDTGNEDNANDEPEMPDTGAGSMAGSVAPMAGSIAASLSLLVMGGLALLRRR